MLLAHLSVLETSRSCIRSRARTSLLNVLSPPNLAPTSPERKLRLTCLHQVPLMLLLAVFSTILWARKGGPQFSFLSILFIFPTLKLYGCISVANGNERCLFTPVAFSREIIISDFFSLSFMSFSSRHLSRIANVFDHLLFNLVLMS